jgi:hypothetical protein
MSLVLRWTMLRTRSLLLPPAPAVSLNERLVEWMKLNYSGFLHPNQNPKLRTNQIFLSVLI